MYVLFMPSSFDVRSHVTKLRIRDRGARFAPSLGPTFLKGMILFCPRDPAPLKAQCSIVIVAEGDRRYQD